MLHNNLNRITWGCNNVCRITYGFFKMAAGNFAWDEVFSFLFWKKKYFPNSCFPSDQFSLLMYLCLLPSSATVKMDNGENIKNPRYATNDETAASAGFIYQMKNRNTSRKTEYDLKLIKHYFASIGEIRKHNMTLVIIASYKYMPYKAMVSENDQLSQILRKMHWSIW